MQAGSLIGGPTSSALARKRSRSVVQLASLEAEAALADSAYPGSKAASEAQALSRAASSRTMDGGGGRGAPSLLRSLGGLQVETYVSWGVVVAAGLVLAVSEQAHPRQHYMLEGQLDLTAYPLKPNTVPAWAMPVICIVLPIAVFGAWAVLLLRRSADLHAVVLGLLAAVLVTGALTNVVKVIIGRPRPDFNARCWPDGKVVWSQRDAYGGWPNCTGDAASAAEGRKSFPSGHSSWAASGLGYTSQFLLCRLRPFDGSGQPWRLAVAAAPAAGALLIGISRVVDYWHHWTDVAAGLGLGFLVAWACYRQQGARLAKLDAQEAGAGGGRDSDPAGESLLRAGANGGSRGALLPL